MGSSCCQRRVAAFLAERGVGTGAAADTRGNQLVCPTSGKAPENAYHGGDSHCAGHTVAGLGGDPHHRQPAIPRAWLCRGRGIDSPLSRFGTATLLSLPDPHWKNDSGGRPEFAKIRGSQRRRRALLSPSTGRRGSKVGW